MLLGTDSYELPCVLASYGFLIAFFILDAYRADFEDFLILQL